MAHKKIKREDMQHVVSMLYIEMYVLIEKNTVENINKAVDMIFKAEIDHLDPDAWEVFIYDPEKYNTNALLVKRDRKRSRDFTQYHIFIHPLHEIK